MTKEEFIGRAADAILDEWGHGDNKAACVLRPQAVELAEAALDAVGAWDLYQVGRIFASDGGRELEHTSGHVDDCSHPACAAVRIAEGR